MIHHCSGGGPPIPLEQTRQIKLARWANTLQDELILGSWDTAVDICNLIGAYLEDEVPLAEALEERVRWKAACRSVQEITNAGKTLEDVPESLKDMLLDAIEKGRDHA